MAARAGWSTSRCRDCRCAAPAGRYWSGDLAVCGFDNGRVLAVHRSNGTTAWEAAVGQSHGSTELARLIDVDAPVVADGDDLFAVAYQGRVARMDRATPGRSSGRATCRATAGLPSMPQAVYVSTADGDVVRLDRQNGAEQWRQKALEQPPAVGPGDLWRPRRGRRFAGVRALARSCQWRFTRARAHGQEAHQCRTARQPMGCCWYSATAASSALSARLQRRSLAPPCTSTANQGRAARASLRYRACCRSSRSSAGRMSASPRCSMR